MEKIILGTPVCHLAPWWLFSVKRKSMTSVAIELVTSIHTKTSSPKTVQRCPIELFWLRLEPVTRGCVPSEMNAVTITNSIIETSSCFVFCQEALDEGASLAAPGLMRVKICQDRTLSAWSSNRDDRLWKNNATYSLTSSSALIHDHVLAILLVYRHNVHYLVNIFS